MKPRYCVIHKLTNKPVRSTQAPYDVFIFDSAPEAQKLVDMKNKIMHADFYKVEVIHDNK